MKTQEPARRITQRSDSERGREGGEEADRGEEGKGKEGTSVVTELIEMSVHPRRARNRADQPGFEEGRPAVDETASSPDVVLDRDDTVSRALL